MDICFWRSLPRLWLHVVEDPWKWLDTKLQKPHQSKLHNSKNAVQLETVVCSGTWMQVTFCNSHGASCHYALPISEIWTGLFDIAYPWLSRTEGATRRYRTRPISSDNHLLPTWIHLRFGTYCHTNKALFFRPREPPIMSINGIIRLHNK